MSKWKQALDVAVSGHVLPEMMPPHIGFLSLPAITSWQDNFIIIEWQASEAIYQGSGMVFGGYISALADYAAGTAMLTSIADDEAFATNKLEVEYKKPVTAGLITIKAEVLKRDGRLIDVRVTFINGADQVCAVAHVYQTILKKSS